MEMQVVVKFVRVLKLGRTVSIPLQLLQTVSIMIQNLRSEHAICMLIAKYSSLLCSYISFSARFNNVDGQNNHLFLYLFADYMFSNEHMNYLITYSFDFRNEELLSYYISFLRFDLMHPIVEWQFMIHEICFLGLYKFVDPPLYNFAN